MASNATEFAYITLKPGVELEGSSTAAQAWHKALTTLKQQEGYQRSYYGRTLEEPNLALLIIDWDNVDSHLKFVAAPAYGPFKETLGILMTGVHVHHITFSPFPPTVLGRAPVIELATFFKVVPTFLSNANKFLEGVGTPDKYYGYATGESVENDVGKHADVVKGEEGVKGKAVVLLIGWESREAHLKFRETEVFKANVGLIREGFEDRELFHVSLKAFE